MFFRSRQFVAPILALVITAGALTAVAQTKSKSSKSSSKSAATEKKEKSKYHRLPTYYGQLELKEEQVGEIYAIKDDYGKKIDDLEAELAKLKDEQAEKIKDVLTRTQVTALNKLLAGTASKEKADPPSSKSSTAKKTTAKKSTAKQSSKKKD